MCLCAKAKKRCIWVSPTVKKFKSLQKKCVYSEGWSEASEKFDQPKCRCRLLFGVLH